MRPNSLPYDIQVPKPCSADWHRMQAASSASRHCEHCARQVHDLSRLTAREVRRLVERTGGDFCARVTHHVDGSMLFREDRTRPAPFPGAGFVLAAALATSGMATSTAEAQEPTRGRVAVLQPVKAPAVSSHTPAFETCAPGLPSPAPVSRPPLMGKPAPPDTSRASVEGRLHAPNAAQVLSSLVLLTNEKGREYRGAAGEDGQFHIQLPPGKYVATVSITASDGNSWFGREALIIREGHQSRDFVPSEPVTHTAGVPVMVPPAAPKKTQP